MNNAAPVLVLLVLVAALGVGVTYYVMSPGPKNDDNSTIENRLPRQEAEFRAKLAEYRMQKEKIQRGIKRFEKQRQEALAHLRKKGINSSADIDPEDVDVQYVIRNLKEIKLQMGKLTDDVDSYDKAIAGLNQMLVKIETRNIQEASQISEEELFELRKIEIDLNERLKPDDGNILEVEELYKLIDEELGDKEAG